MLYKKEKLYQKKKNNSGFWLRIRSRASSPVSVIQRWADTTEGEGARFPPICKKNDCWAQIFQITVVAVSD